MTVVSITPFSFKASGHSARLASAGVWAAGGATHFGKREQVRYAAVRSGAGADAQTVGIRGKLTRGAQHKVQPDGLRAARSSRRLTSRWATS
jgi:hypothetical protein